MGSDRNRHREAHSSGVGKGASGKSKSGESRDKKAATANATSKSGNNKKQSGKNLGMPADVESGPEGQVNRTTRRFSAVD